MAEPPVMDVSVADGLLRPVTLSTMNLGPWLVCALWSSYTQT